MNCVTYIYYCEVKNIGGKKTLVNLANHSFFVDFITFPLQMDFNLPKFFCQISCSPYSPNFLLPKFPCQSFPYTVCRANGQMHVSLNASSIKIINKLCFAIYQFKSTRMVSWRDLYKCFWAMIAITAAAKILIKHIP